MRFLLITGIPCTGKTTIGNYLQENYAFIHLDMELILSYPNAWQSLINSILEAKKSDRDLVITWGFMPVADDEKILKLKEMGAKMIWFDGNRIAAREAFIKRGTVSENLLNLQMNRIENADIINTFKPIVFNIFKEDGSFKKKEEIVSKLLEL